MSEYRGYLGRSVGECVSMLAHFGSYSIDALVLGVQGVCLVSDVARANSLPAVRKVEATPEYILELDGLRNIKEVEPSVCNVDELKKSFAEWKALWCD